MPYRGASQAVTDLLGGQLDGLFGDVPTVITQVKAGKLKALAATRRSARKSSRRCRPSWSRASPTPSPINGPARSAPARTAPAVIAKLNAAFNGRADGCGGPRQALRAGVTPSPSTPEEFARYLAEEIARWGRLIREKGIKGD